MTPLFPAQRAAEEFDQALGGTATKAVADRYVDLLDTVEVLHAQHEVLPRAEFVSDLRSRLMTAAETELVAAPSVVRRIEPARETRHRRRLGTLAASLVIVGGSAGMAAAASGALPGEPLYPIKRGIEQVTAAVHVSEVGKGEALLDQAATRLDEVRELEAQGSPDPDLVAATLDSFRSAAEQGSDKLFTAYQSSGETKDITTVRSFTSQHMADIAALASLADSATDDLRLDAADTLADIDQQARVLCRACGSEAALAPPDALSAGSGATTVQNLLARPVAQAQVDIAQLEAARLELLREAASAAEKTAGTIPKIENPTGADTGSGLPSFGSSDDGPVTSTITSDGRLVPTTITAGGAAVKDLLTGVTSTVEDVTKSVTGGLTGSETPLDETVSGLTDTVDETTDGLLP